MDKPSESVYRPIYHRAPNRFLRYELYRFNDGAGNFGERRVAFYLDKKGVERSETAQIIWDSNSKMFKV